MRVQLSAISIIVALAATGAAAETIGGADVPRPRTDMSVQVPQAGPRPTSPLGQLPDGPLTLGAHGDGGAAADAAVDAMLGVVPVSQAAQGAKHIYVDDNGDLACVTLDTFLPESC